MTGPEDDTRARAVRIAGHLPAAPVKAISLLVAIVADLATLARIDEERCVAALRAAFRKIRSLAGNQEIH